MILTLLQGLLIGLIFGVPVGAVGAMTVQRTWERGFWAGFITGLGSSAADCCYAVVGAFGITLISDFLTAHEIAVNLIGGCLIVFLGIRLLLKQDGYSQAETRSGSDMAAFLSAFGIGITNPAAIVTFLFAFSWFGLEGKMNGIHAATLVLGVLFGTAVWWALLSRLTCLFKKRAGDRNFRRFHQICGAVLLLFGVAVFVRVLLHL